MNFRVFSKKLLGLFIISGLIFFLLFYNAPTWQKSAIFLFYWLITAKWWRRILVVRFDFSPRALRVRLLAALGALMSAGWIIGLSLCFYHFTPLSVALALFGAGLLPLIFWRENQEESEMLAWFDDNLKILQEMPRNKAGVFLYVVLWLITAHQLFTIGTDGLQGVTQPSPVTPWQILPSAYIYWFGAATLVLGFLCFAKLPAKVVLVLLCAHAFLLTSYLPATHEYFYNADSWRHLGQELNLVAGNSFSTVAPIGESNFWQKLDIGRLGYAQFWSLGIIGKTFFNFDLMSFNRWFGPILWALFFPILAFEWGRALGWKKSESLFLVWLGFLPFGLQIAGATTLPVNIDFLFWLFLLLMIVKRPVGEKLGILFLAIAGVLLIFGYTLYFILFWLAWMVYFVIARSAATRQSIFIFPLVFILVALSIPIIELITNYSQFNPNINWLGQAQQTVGNFSAYYFASGPRPHDIASGNILFNQAPSYAFVVNILMQWRWWLVGFAILFWFVTLFGAFLSLRGGATGADEAIYRPRQKLLALLFLGLMSGNIISRYFLTGDNLLARRLDVVLAWLAIIMVAGAINFVIARIRRLSASGGEQSIALLFIIFIISLAITASYSLGPDAKTVSRDEYQAMDYVYSVIASEEKQSRRPCVLADTYPLLALEAISAKTIIGGGFPMGQNFAQPERVQLFNKFKMRSAEAILADSKILTGASRCFGVVKEGEVRYNNKAIVKKFGDILVIEN